MKKVIVLFVSLLLFAPSVSFGLLIVNGIEIGGAASGYIKADGTVPLTADWDAGPYTITVYGLDVDTGAITFQDGTTLNSASNLGQWTLNGAGDTITPTNIANSWVLTADEFSASYSYGAALANNVRSSYTDVTLMPNQWSTDTGFAALVDHYYDPSNTILQTAVVNGLTTAGWGEANSRAYTFPLLGFAYFYYWSGSTANTVATSDVITRDEPTPPTWSPVPGDMIYLTHSDTAADQGLYRIIGGDITNIQVDRALTGTDSETEFIHLSQGIAMISPDATNGPIITGMTANNKPMQLGGVTSINTTGLDADDVVTWDKLQITGASSAASYSVIGGGFRATSAGAESLEHTITTLHVTNGPYSPETLTDKAFVLGNGTGALQSAGVLTNGQTFIGSTGADPVAATPTDNRGRLEFTVGAGTLDISPADSFDYTLVKSVSIADGGTYTPPAWHVVDVELSCTTDEAAFTLAEDNAIDGQYVIITQSGSNVCTMAHSDGLQNIGGGATIRLSQYNSALFKYSTDRYVYLGGSQDQVALGSREIGINATDGAFSGTYISLTVDAAAAYSIVGQAYHIDSDGELICADADVAAQMPASCIALDTGAGASKRCLLNGTITVDAWNWTPGQVLYVSTAPSDPGGLTSTVPSTSADIVQVVGIALTDDTALIDMGGRHTVVVP